MFGASVKQEIKSSSQPIPSTSASTSSIDIDNLFLRKKKRKTSTTFGYDSKVDDKIQDVFPLEKPFEFNVTQLFNTKQKLIRFYCPNTIAYTDSNNNKTSPPLSLHHEQDNDDEDTKQVKDIGNSIETLQHRQDVFFCPSCCFQEQSSFGLLCDDNTNNNIDDNNTRYRIRAFPHHAVGRGVIPGVSEHPTITSLLCQYFINKGGSASCYRYTEKDMLMMTMESSTAFDDKDIVDNKQWIRMARDKLRYLKTLSQYVVKSLKIQKYKDVSRKGRFRAEEIHIHLSLDHPNIVKMHCVLSQLPQSPWFRVWNRETLNLNLNAYYESSYRRHERERNPHLEFLDFVAGECKIDMILEACNTHDLECVIQKTHFNRKLNTSEIRFILAQLIRALHYLHFEKHIIHGDIKPSNILFQGTKVKLCDFGLSFHVPDLVLSTTHVHHTTTQDKMRGENNNDVVNLDRDGDDDNNTYDKTFKRYQRVRAKFNDKINTISGTPNYIAPEVILRRNNIKYPFARDMWSLGCLLFCMWTGKPPFETSELKETYKHIIRAQYTFPRDCIPKYTLDGIMYRLGGYFNAPNAANDNDYCERQIDDFETSMCDESIQILSHDKENYYLCDLISKLLRRDPRERPTSHQVLQHPFLTQIPTFHNHDELCLYLNSDYCRSSNDWRW